MQLSRIGPIALEEPLGGVADSNVLRGVHVERNMTMAVKLLPRHLVNRPMGGDTFADDVKRLQQLVHPNIVRVYGGAMDHGQPYLAMEMVDGESLRCLLDRRGRLSWETTADIAEAICDALDYAHRSGLVHQRLTPSRIMLRPDGSVKIIGFDCQLADRDEVLGLRSPMSVASYLSPEVFRGKSSAGEPTCDMFSLGVIIYECLTGELPWSAATPAEAVQARRDHAAPRVSAKVLECPVWLDVLVARLLEVKRGIRLATADATRRAIVDAKRKVAAGMGAAQQAWSGRQGALTVDTDRKEISALRRQQAAVEQDDSPFYERAWFLAACLAAVVAAAAWLMWPKSEDALYAAARPLMESNDAVNWRLAQNKYIDELKRRFPDGKYSAEIDAFEDRVRMNRALEKIKNIERFGRTPESDAERIFAAADRHQRFDDLTTAWSLYEKVLEKADTADDYQRAYAHLARDRIAEIKSQAAAAHELGELLQSKLDQAEQLVSQSQPLLARNILDEIVTLYSTNRDVKPLVDEASLRLRQLDSERDRRN